MVAFESNASTVRLQGIGPTAPSHPVPASKPPSPEEEQQARQNQALTEIKKTARMLDNNMDRFSLANEKELSLKEKLDVQRLEQMERSVREHERTHMTAARDLAISNPNFRLERGPDGQKYAVGGEVNISASFISSDPQATIEKALKIERTALAPADPSSKDMQVAAQARTIASKAYRKISREQMMEIIHKPLESEKQYYDIPVGATHYQKQQDFQKNLFTMLDLLT